MRVAEARARLLRARVSFRIAVAEVWSAREGRSLERGSRARVEEEGLRVLRNAARRPVEPAAGRRSRPLRGRPRRTARTALGPAALVAAAGLASAAVAVWLGWGESAALLAASLSVVGTSWALWKGRPR